MKKFPLHQMGILELQKTLYALPDSKLAIEVFNLRTDFKEWVKAKFELHTSEIAFIDELNPHLAEYMAIKASNFLAQRKPIHFTVIEFKPELIEANVQQKDLPV